MLSNLGNNKKTHQAVSVFWSPTCFWIWTATTTIAFCSSDLQASTDILRCPLKAWKLSPQILTLLTCNIAYKQAGEKWPAWQRFGITSQDQNLAQTGKCRQEAERDSLIFKSRSQTRNGTQVQALDNKKGLFPKQSSRRLTTAWYNSARTGHWHLYANLAQSKCQE